MNLDQLVAGEITLLLAESGLSVDVVTIINSWLDYNTGEKGRFAFAQLTLAICDSVGGVLEVALKGAIAMELYALAADILDDIQDQDNHDLPWRKVPSAQAINLATCILVLSYTALSRLLEHSQFENVSNVLNQMGLQACDGQFQEFTNDSKESITLEEYFSTIMKKSGGLTAGACKIGAILGGTHQTFINQLEHFGMNLGVMNQIKNDFADFLNIDTKNDFARGRKTLPFVYLLNVLDEEDVETFKALSSMANKGLDMFGLQERDQLSKIVMNEGTTHYCCVMYELYKQRAIAALDNIPFINNRKEKLMKFVE